jgi:hypothetical protein
MFDFIFEKLSPHEFATFFEQEIYQARAFLLSFSPTVEYVQEVVKIYNDEDFTAHAKKYLANVEKENVNAQFVNDVYQYLEKRIDDIDKSIPRRKNMLIERESE